MFNRLREDIACIKARDPAAKNSFEVLMLYPGLRAVRSYRRAHALHEHGFEFVARWISQRAARKTGIEIHPGATIGKRLFIDHGTGVVIGETTTIGDDVTIYQCVTLGGTGKDVGKRHPTIGNGVMVGAGAKVLGPITVGDNAKIAAGSVVLKDIPSNSTAVGIPAHVVKLDGIRVDYLDQIHIPDPIWQEIEFLENRICELETRLIEAQQKAIESESEEK